MVGGFGVRFRNPVAVVSVSVLTLLALQRSEQTEVVRVVPVAGLKALPVELGFSEGERFESFIRDEVLRPVALAQNYGRIAENQRLDRIPVGADDRDRTGWCPPAGVETKPLSGRFDGCRKDVG
jgi:hypothetical protein